MRTDPHYRPACPLCGWRPPGNGEASSKERPWEWWDVTDKYWVCKKPGCTTQAAPKLWMEKALLDKFKEIDDFNRWYQETKP